MRQLPEWIGKSDDSAIPERVKLRIALRDGGRCQHCTRKVGIGFEKPDYDHIVSLINGGANAESNIQLLCKPCHKAKTAQDVAEKAVTARVRSKHLGIKKPKNPMPGSRASGLRKRMDGTVERRT